MKIFLAGATGVIGRLLVPLLVKAGHEVIGTTRSPAKTAFITDLGAQPLVLDALDREAVFAALNDARPDVVIHQLTDLATRDFAGNTRLRIEGSRNLVDASLAVGVQRMIAESIAFMYASGTTSASETDPLDVQSATRGSGAKAVQSLEDAAAEMPVGVVLRYGILYGPGTWYARESLTTDQIHQGELAATDSITSFLHVADAAQAAVDALTWPAGIYNIIDDVPAAGVEWMPLYADLIGAPKPPVRSEKLAWERGASNAKAKHQGWRPLYPDWREGFQVELK